MHLIELKKKGKRIETHLSQGITGDILNAVKEQCPNFYKDFGESKESYASMRFEVDHTKQKPKIILQTETQNQEA